MVDRKERIHNPVVGRYYEVRQRTTKEGKAGQIMGLWKSKGETEFSGDLLTLTTLWFIDTNVLANWILDKGGVIDRMVDGFGLSNEMGVSVSRPLRKGPVNKRRRDGRS